MRTTINGVEYEARWPLTMTLEHNQLSIRTDPPMREPVDRCEHCGRADWREVTVSSLDEAVERGWLVPL